MNNYKLITISHRRRVNVSICGSGKEVILLLARKTSPSPVLETKPLCYYLQERFTVVTLDYLGCGYSDNYHSERTLDNIASEIHEVMLSLNYTNYTIVAHAYAGLYSLYYANKYPTEVNTVIGIDSFVAEQIEYSIKGELSQFCEYMWRDYHKSRILQWIVRKMASCHLRKAEKQIYTIDDIVTYSKLSQKRLDEMLLLERYDRRKENFETLRGVKFPQHIPVLFILSSYGCRKMCNWYTIREKMLQHSISKIVTLHGKKDFYLRSAKRISEEIFEFIHMYEQHKV